MSYQIAVHYWDREDERFPFVGAPTYNDCIEPLAESLSLSLLRTWPSVLVISSLDEAIQLIQELEVIVETARKALSTDCLITSVERIEVGILTLKDILNKTKWDEIASIYIE